MDIMTEQITKIWEQLALPLLNMLGEAIVDFDFGAFVLGTIDFVFHLSLTHYLLLGAVLFTIGLLGVMTRRNLIAAIISIELMLNAANINFLAFGQYLGQSDGSVMVILIMALAAAEVAIGLAIGLALYRRYGTIDIEQFNKLRG